MSNGRVYSDKLKEEWINKFASARSTGTVDSNGIIWMDHIASSTSYTTINYPIPSEPQQFLPIAMQVSAATVGFDLVAVTPMSMPSVNLAWISDFIYQAENEYKVYYINTLGDDSSVVVVGRGIDDAVSKIEDLREVKFHTDYGPVDLG